MTEAAATLAPFVAALGLREDGAILLDDRPVGRVTGAITDEALAAALMPIVYEHAYARAYPPPEPIEVGEPGDVTTLLEHANAGRSRIEHGWVFSGSEANGSVLATRHNRTRRFAPGQFLAVDGVLPLRKGGALVVQIPGGSATAQSGFYYAFGRAFRDVNDLGPVVRFYWNVALGGAVGMMTALTALLDRYAIPFEFKIVVRSADFARRDNAVLYVAQDLFPAVSTVLMADYPAFAGFLDDTVPLFARRLAPGLGFAEDPGHRESFGMARSRLVAQALVAARRDAGFAPALFADALTVAIATAGLDAEALWLNPGSHNLYHVPPAQAVH